MTITLNCVYFILSPSWTKYIVQQTLLQFHSAAVLFHIHTFVFSCEENLILVAFHSAENKISSVGNTELVLVSNIKKRAGFLINYPV